jgi:hypothetical protein
MRNIYLITLPKLSSFSEDSAKSTFMNRNNMHMLTVHKDHANTNSTSLDRIFNSSVF